jgi:hypothetical protein
MMHIAVGLIAAITMIGYIGRIDRLNVGIHQANVVCVHITLASLVMQGLIHAFERATNAQDITGILAAITWLMLTDNTWKDGVPSYFRTEKLPPYVIGQ